MKYFLIFLMFFIPLFTFANDNYIIFNSTDDYINIRVEPTGKIIKEVYRGDFLFGITYSINSINDKWYNAFDGVIHAGQVKIVNRDELLAYINKTLPEELGKINDKSIQDELLADNPWIMNFTEKEFKTLNARSQYNFPSFNDKIEGVMWLINLINRKEYSEALKNASLYGYYKTAKWLIDNGAECTPKYRKVVSTDIYKQESLAIRDALYYGTIGANNIKVIELLLKNGAAINNKYINVTYPEYIFVNACKKGNIEVIKLLIDYGADIDIVKHNKSVYNPSPLQIAIELNRLDIVKLLIEKGIYLNYSIIDSNMVDLHESPKDYAWRLGYKDIYNYILSKENSNL